MGRKNHQSHGSRQVRRSKTPGRPVINPQFERIPIEKIVIPKGKCFAFNRRGKLMFSKDDVETALKQAQHSRHRRGQLNQTEARYYACPEGGCGQYHLTSRTTWEDRSR